MCSYSVIYNPDLSHLRQLQGPSHRSHARFLSQCCDCHILSPSRMNLPSRGRAHVSGTGRRFSTGIFANPHSQVNFTSFSWEHCHHKGREWQIASLSISVDESLRSAWSRLVISGCCRYDVCPLDLVSLVTSFFNQIFVPAIENRAPRLPDFQLNIFATFSKYLENPGNIQEAFFPNNLYIHPESKQKMSSQTCTTLSHQSSSCTESMDPACPNSPHRKRAWNISPGPCRCPSGLESPWESPGGAWPYSACSQRSCSPRLVPRRISAGSNGRGPCPGSRSSGPAEMAPAPRGLLRRTGHRPGLGPWDFRMWKKGIPMDLKCSFV